MICALSPIRRGLLFFLKLLLPRMIPSLVALLLMLKMTALGVVDVVGVVDDMINHGILPPLLLLLLLLLLQLLMLLLLLLLLVLLLMMLMMMTVVNVIMIAMIGRCRRQLVIVMLLPEQLLFAIVVIVHGHGRDGASETTRVHCVPREPSPATIHDAWR